MGDVRTIDPQEQWRLLIGGEWTSTASTYEIVDPNTTAVVGHAPDATVADADGYNAQQVLSSDDPILSPAWSPGTIIRFSRTVSVENSCAI